MFCALHDSITWHPERSLKLIVIGEAFCVDIWNWMEPIVHNILPGVYEEWWCFQPKCRVHKHGRNVLICALYLLSDPAASMFGCGLSVSLRSVNSRAVYSRLVRVPDA